MIAKIQLAAALFFMSLATIGTALSQEKLNKEEWMPIPSRIPVLCSQLEVGFADIKRLGYTLAYTSDVARNPGLKTFVFRKGEDRWLMAEVSKDADVVCIVYEMIGVNPPKTDNM